MTQPDVMDSVAMIADTEEQRSPASGEETPHISVCVCTYKRPLLLKRLLTDLSRQHTGGLFTYSIVVADNDKERSAEAVLAEFQSGSAIP